MGYYEPDEIEECPCANDEPCWQHPDLERWGALFEEVPNDYDEESRFVREGAM